MGLKNFWVLKLFGKKKNRFEKFLGQKKILSKKTGRVNPRGRIYDYPPPQKIVGLKFCWAILSCPKRFFVKKKNIGGGWVVR